MFMPSDRLRIYVPFSNELISSLPLIFCLINSLKCLNEKGIILFHDCFPLTYYDQACPRAQRKWNGDVWKAIVHSRTYDHADTYTCVADHGIGIIFKRKNMNRLIIEEKNFKKLKFKHYYNNHKKFMNIISYKEIEKVFY